MGRVSACFEGVLAFFPVARAEFVGLEGVKDAECFFDIATDVEVVLSGPSEDSSVVDDKGAAQGDAFIGQDAVVLGDLFGDIAKDGVFEAGETFVRFDPTEVAKDGVGGGGDYDGVAIFKVSDGVVKGDQLGRANKSEVHRIEEQDHPFSFEGIEVDIFEFASNEGLTFEVRGGFSDL